MATPPATDGGRRTADAGKAIRLVRAAGHGGDRVSSNQGQDLALDHEAGDLAGCIASGIDVDAV
jgi:hypothetical protein